MKKAAPARPYKLPRPRQIQELSPDQLVAVIWRLAMEICVLRDRLSTHEELLSEKDLLSRKAIEAHTPSAEESAARRKARTELIENIINDLSEPASAPQPPGGMDIAEEGMRKHRDAMRGLKR